MAIKCKVRACVGLRKISPATGALPLGRKASEKPGISFKRGACSNHCLAMIGVTAKPEVACSMAGSKSFSKFSFPNFCESAAHADTAPGTVTLAQPSFGISGWVMKSSVFHSSGNRPDAFRPCNSFPSQTIQNASEPMPFMVGSTTVRVIAVAIAASTAFPPNLIIWSPASTANGCVVATIFSPVIDFLVLCMDR